MGGGSWSVDAFKSVSTARASAPRDHVFTSSAVDPAMDSKKVVLRESRDSADHPNSNAIAVFFDVTGSMGSIPEYFAREALGSLMRELLTKLPVQDPQLLIGAVGDAHGFPHDKYPFQVGHDKYPFQVGQFESDNRIDDWLTKVVLEGGGGGTFQESYGLAHYFAARRTSLDCYEKRGRKGYLFTVGDEEPYANMPAEELSRVFEGQHEDVDLETLIAECRERYHVFHIVVASNSYPNYSSAAKWEKYLGTNVLRLQSYKALAELIMTTIALTEGMSMDAATKGFSATTTELVRSSGVSMIPRAGAAAVSTGVVSL